MATRAMATMWAMAMVVRLAGDKDDKGKGGKGNLDGDVKVAGKEEDGGKVDCNGNKEGDCDGNEGGKGATATAMATKGAMVTATRVVGNEEGICNSCKSNGDGNKGGG
jgi:hypothetical protein